MSGNPVKFRDGLYAGLSYLPANHMYPDVLVVKLSNSPGSRNLVCPRQRYVLGIDADGRPEYRLDGDGE